MSPTLETAEKISDQKIQIFFREKNSLKTKLLLQHRWIKKSVDQKRLEAGLGYYAICTGCIKQAKFYHGVNHICLFAVSSVKKGDL